MEAMNAWLRELLDAHMLPLMYTLEVLEKETVWRDREIAWIATYKEHGADVLNDEVSRFEGECMEEIRQRNKTKEEPRRRYISLVDLPDFRLGEEGDVNGFDATDSEFLHFVQTLVPVTGENLDHWTWEERRDFLNWCLDEQILQLKDGCLVPFEESIPTEPLPIEPTTEGA
jgi:hypothetical protein